MYAYGQITVEEWMEEFGVERWRAIRMMKRLADLGVCVFKSGRKGWPSRLEKWGG